MQYFVEECRTNAKCKKSKFWGIDLEYVPYYNGLVKPSLSCALVDSLNVNNNFKNYQ